MSRERFPEGYETLIYEPGPVTKIIHNESEKRNPLTGQFILEFSDTLKKFQRNPEAVIGVILAVGPVFCSGHDLRFVSKMEEWSPASELTTLSEEDWRDQMDFMREKIYYPLWDCKKPLIAGVQGSVHAGGIDIMLMCDIVIMAENVELDFAIYRITGAGGPNLIPYFVGFKKAAEIHLTGKKISAIEAEQAGMVNKVVPQNRLEEEVMKYANAIAELGTEKAKLIKQDQRFVQNRMGAREAIWFGCETNILGHLTKSRREKEFYTILKKHGMKAALEYRDKPFKQLDVS